MGFQEHNGSIEREQYIVLLPVKDNIVRTYPEGEILQIATSVALGGFSGDDDQTNVASVDSFFVKLEEQSFPSVGGNHPA